jgi:hypothetical protein
LLTLSEYESTGFLFQTSQPVDDVFVYGSVLDCANRPMTNAGLLFPESPAAAVRVDAMSGFQSEGPTTSDGAFVARGFTPATMTEIVAFGRDPACAATCGSCVTIATLPFLVPSGPAVVIALLRP